MLSVFHNVKCYPTRMTDIPQCQMVSVFRKKVKYYPRLMSDMTLHNAKCFPYSTMLNVIPDPWQAWSSTMPNVIRIPQCQMLSRTHDRHGIPQCQTLSHTHGSRLGKAMEDCPPAKRFRPSITFWPSHCGHEGFCGGDVASVVLPDGIEELEDHAYEHWLHVTSVTLPNSVKIIGEYAFYDCRSLSSLTLSNSLRIVGDYACGSCFGLTSLTLPNSVQSLGDGAFERCGGLTSLTLPNSLSSIGVGAFSHCKRLMSLTLPTSLERVASGAFEGCCGLTSLTLPNSLKTIGNQAFSHCEGLTSLTLPDSVKAVGTCSFENCIKLTHISLPHSLWNVGKGAFCDCIDLASTTSRSMSRPALIAWAVGSSRNRDNWQLTSVMRLRNVLSLITLLALESCDVVSSLDPDGHRCVFMGCPCGVVPEYENDYDDDWRNGLQGVEEHGEYWREWVNKWA